MSLFFVYLKFDLVYLSTLSVRPCISSVFFISGATPMAQPSARAWGTDGGHKSPYKVVSALLWKISEYPGCPAPLPIVPWGHASTSDPSHLSGWTDPTLLGQHENLRPRQL